ncbi:hypothetical protein O181_031610 [Austropuccinia psidii MF-1]|uniref:Uncharacterized protein n=1 Tax=Austropuccinia psidii MF-1 TaxID=1389203 RepID=A0A9Q3CY86_9BASI|nr:hypothetical protein [Austropuccinia psidii MF-1]
MRCIDRIKEDFELPYRLVTARSKILFTRSAHRWYIRSRQAHGHQSWTLWENQIINKWANDTWRFKVETAFEYAKFNADEDRALPCFCKQKDISTELYTDISGFMIHRKFLRQCGEEGTTRIIIDSRRVNLKTKLNRPWKDSVDKNPKANSSNMKYKSADMIRKCHIFQSTENLANTCPNRGKMNKIEIKKEPDVEKEDVIEDNSDDKSSIFPELFKRHEKFQYHI